MTDLVKRATSARRGADRTTSTATAWRASSGSCAWLQPGAVCFVGLAGYRVAVDRHAVAGVQPDGIGGRPAYVMPNTSGLNARVAAAELADHLRAAARRCAAAVTG